MAVCVMGERVSECDNVGGGVDAMIGLHVFIIKRFEERLCRFMEPLGRPTRHWMRWPR
jgi:hypothetical protein